MVRRGKKLETLVAWIEKALAETAEVVPNAKLPDKETGRLRQVDVAVFLKDSHHRLLFMIEVRDHTRPVGSSYIEETYGKATSIGAANVVIVSSSGFTRPAQQKANKRGIRLLTYQQAISGDWAKWAPIRFFTVYKQQIDVPHMKVNVDFPEEQREMILEAIRRDPPDWPSARPFEIKPGERLSAFDIVKGALKTDHPVWQEVISSGKSVRRRIIIHASKSGPSLMFVAGDIRIPVQSIEAFVELSAIAEHVPVKVMRLSNAEKADHIAEVLTAVVEDDQGPLQFEIMVKGAPEIIEKGGVVHLRVSRPEAID